MNERIPVIIDTDPGVDDTLAIMIAASCGKLDIVGITPVEGNVLAKYTRHNALALRDFLGLDCPVVRGADRQLEVQLTTRAEGIHGVTGMGSVVLPEPHGDFAEGDAWDFIYEQAKSRGKLTLIAIGPLTDVAIMLQKHPDAKDYIDKIAVMGGSTTKGNTTPYAEFNFWADPPAAKLVFESGIPVVMAGLNITLETGVPISLLARLGKLPGRVAPIVAQLSEKYNEIALGRSDRPVSVVHDALAVFYVAYPELCRTERCRIDVNAVPGDEHWGQSVVTYDDPASFNAELLTGIDMDAYLACYEKAVAYFQ